MPYQEKSKAQLIAELEELRQQVEAERQLNEASLAALVESTDDRFWSVDTRSRLLMVSTTIRQQIEERIGRPFQPGENDLAADLPMEVRAEWQDYLIRALGGETFTVERQSQIDVSHRWIEYRFHPILTAGEIVGVTVLGRDITRRKQAEAALRESEEYYRVLFENSADGVLLTAPDGRILRANPAACKMFGRTEAELCQGGRSLIVNMHDPQVAVALAERARTGRARVELTYIRGDGSTFQGEVTSVIFQTQNGEQRTSMSIRDTSERRRMEAALAQNEADLRALMNAADESILLLEPDGTIVALNEEVAARLHLPPTQMVGRCIFDFIPPETAVYRRTFMDQVVATGRPVSFEDQRLGRWIDNHIFPVLDENGRVTRLAIFGRDVTERRQANEILKSYSVKLEVEVEQRTRDLRAAQEKLILHERLAVLGQLAGSVSHELRNPLGVINNAVYFLSLIQPDASEKVKQYLSIISHEARTADKIVTDLLDFSRLKSVEREAVSVPELVRLTLERFPAPEKVAVTLALAPDLMVFVDPRQATQILGNLITNACQAMPGGGCLVLRSQVAVREGCSFAAIRVEDSGVGIPPENMARLFEPLFTTKRKGIGLGLAVCKKLTEANGGWMEVVSEPGKGSAFTFYLPVSQ